MGYYQYLGGVEDMRPIKGSQSQSVCVRNIRLCIEKQKPTLTNDSLARPLEF